MVRIRHGKHYAELRWLMPYHIEKAGSKYLVKGPGGKKVYGTHSSRAKAQAQIYAIEMSERKRKK